MTVFAHYAGSRFEIAGSAGSIAEVRDRIQRQFWVIDARLNTEEDPSTIDPNSAHLVKPWIALPLASGSELHVWVHDGLHIAFESDEPLVTSATD